MQLVRRYWPFFLIALFLVAAAGGWWLTQALATGSAESRVEASSELARLAATEQDIKVYKTPWCGCCTAWVDYLEEQGFTTDVLDVDQEQLNSIKMAAGMSQSLASCHTAFVNGYVVEGHVPAEDIRRLLDEAPSDVVGIAVPGMPIGSPGMEQGDRKDPYDVVAFDAEGNTRVYSQHNQ
ncbi:MAG: DUF411 domain-containing protein [Ectothiorhodospiraceae bacterium]|nr:DUF411 domain-containing protein [Ectothiorhodospiraceae bacterium]MCH8505899.1 DUF411 domain-containing protein [Ectothiorhodospiraceae bacterium]